MYKPKINVYPRHDDFGHIAKKQEKFLNWWYEQNKSIIEYQIRIELLEKLLYEYEDDV